MENSVKKAYGNSAWVMASKIVSLLVGVAVNICVTRYLGAEKRGIMANAQAISGFWGFLAIFGLTDIMISKFSSKKKESGIYAGSGLALMLTGGIAAFLLSAFSAILLGQEPQNILYVTICSVSYLFQCLSIFDYWFYSNSTSKHYAIIQSVLHILFLVIRIFGVVLKAELVFFIIILTTEIVIGYISLPLCYMKNGPPFEGAIRPKVCVIRDLAKMALPMLAMGFATTIYMKVDQIMVGEMIGNKALGTYSVAVNLAEYWYFVPMTIYSSFLPIITISYANNEGFTERLQEFADIMALLAYVAAIGVMLLGNWAIPILFGFDFQSSAHILNVYIWTGLFTCLSYSGQAYYIIHGDTKTIMWINLCGALLNFLLNLCFITIWGSIGAALATLVEYALVAFGQMLILRKKYGELYKIQLKSLFPFVRIYHRFIDSIQKK